MTKKEENITAFPQLHASTNHQLKNAQAICSNTNTVCSDSLEKPKELVMLEKTALVCTTEDEAS